MNRIVFAVALALSSSSVAVGCAEEPGPETGDEAVAAREPAAPPAADDANATAAVADADAPETSPQAKSICIDFPWGTTVCCTPTSCVEF